MEVRTEFQVPKKCKDRDTTPERTKIWTEPKPKREKKVHVVYYLSRNGQLEHPHFMEVPLSSSQGLYLRDVINRLNILRGKAMASMYSWSSKRSYKNGFVWNDLLENDFIYPAHGQEYILKGTELIGGSFSFRSNETESSSSEKQPETNKPNYDYDFPIIVRRRNQQSSSIDLHEYAGKAADVSTQTEDKGRRRRRRTIREEEEEEEEEKIRTFEEESFQNHTAEFSREEISPAPSNSSPETLESLIKANGRLINRSGSVAESDIRDQTANNHPSGRIKASAILMQLISCGSISVKDNGSTSGNYQGFSLISHFGSRLPSGALNQVSKEVENPSFGGMRLEDKEYFSGSLIETKMAEFPALKRSSSYNADRSSELDLEEREMEGVRVKCIPRKPKTPQMKKEGTNDGQMSRN